MSSKRARGKQQIYRKKINENNTKVKSNASKKRKQQPKPKTRLRLQDDLLCPDYILRKVFRKDGPPLGVEFDNLPSHAFQLCKGKDSKISHRACQEHQRALKRRKVSEPTILEDQNTSPESDPAIKHGIGKGLMTVSRLINQDNTSVKKHGIGKGLMTIWRLTNPAQRVAPQFPVSTSRKPSAQAKKKLRQHVTKRSVNKAQVKKSSTRNKKVRCQQVDKAKPRRREICELALEGGRSNEDLSQYAMLVDDEELELRELQEASNPLTCSHFVSDGLHTCSLCKDLLAKFPPNSVNMKQPLPMQPWDSSPELVKKLFKIFHFLCTYAGFTGIFSFTLDELAQAFNDKDSLLLGKINLALLELLLADVEKELGSGFISHVSKNWKYRALLQWVERQDSVLKMWKRSLNPLTWIEILRQVLVAAGFGSKRDASPREPLTKETALMAKHGLSSGTLKGELFTILSLQGNMGLKVSELATFPSVVGLKLAATTDEVEQLISSMLSSDITLFEKISSSTYRLRNNGVAKDAEDDQSDLEDFGSVDDDTKNCTDCSSTDDSDEDSEAAIASEMGQLTRIKSNEKMSTINTEIDESHPGEVWLLGLMEGEYSDLNIEEKLNALLALIDLLSAGSSIRMEESAASSVECAPTVHHIGSGAKIKRSTAKQKKMPISFGNSRQMISSGEPDTLQYMQPVDSSATISMIQEKSSSHNVDDIHPMQSIFLGSDRRYNRYWLFLGPCSSSDPGHSRIYFESSEDGLWEVIDTEEDLSTLLSALDQRGRREAHLLSSLEKREAVLCQAMSTIHNDVRLLRPAISGESERSISISRDDSSSAVSDVDNLASTSAVVVPIGNREQQKQKWSRLQSFDAWLWNSFHSALDAVKNGRMSFIDSLAKCERCHDLYWRDEKHCRICHITFELNFDLEEKYAIHAATCRDTSDPDMFPKHKILSSQLQTLKSAAYTIESSMPEGAMVGAWTKSAHNLWVKRLRRTSTLVELVQVLADFVGAINEGYQRDKALGFDYVMDDIIASFAAMPQTSSAVGLWLVKLDALIAPHLQKVDLEKRTGVRTRTRSKSKDGPVQ